jgi:hypothetical protein
VSRIILLSTVAALVISACGAAGSPRLGSTPAPAATTTTAAPSATPDPPVATDDLGFPLITQAQIRRVKKRSKRTAVFGLLGGRGDRSTRYDTTYDKLPAFDECFAYGLDGTEHQTDLGTDYTRWEFCFSSSRLVFKRRVPS